MHRHDPCSPSHIHPVPSLPVGPPRQVIALNALNLETELLGRSTQVPVIVLIGSRFLPGNARLDEELRSLAARARFRWILATVNADTEAEVLAKFRPVALPAVYAVVDGASVGVFEGDEGLESWVSGIVSRAGLPGLEATEATEEAAEEEPEEVPAAEQMAADPRLLRAAVLVNDGEFGEAVDLYGQLLHSFPGNPTLLRARVAVSVLARSAQADRSVDPVGAAQADPADVEAALRAADALVLFDEPAAALALLEDRLRRASQSGGGALRARIAELGVLLD